MHFHVKSLVSDEPGIEGRKRSKFHKRAGSPTAIKSITDVLAILHLY